MNRPLLMAACFSAAVSATAAVWADKMSGSMDPARCAKYAKLVTDHQVFTDGSKSIDENFDPSDIYDVLKACPSQAKLFKAFDVLFDFVDVQGREDGPKGQGWDPNITEAERQQVLDDLKADSWKTVHGYEQQVKDGKLDAKALKATMRYMIWQKTQYTPYKGAGLELMARMYPNDYAGVKELSKDMDGSYDTWQEVYDEWLGPPPAKH